MALRPTARVRALEGVGDQLGVRVGVLLFVGVRVIVGVLLRVGVGVKVWMAAEGTVSVRVPI